MLRKIEFKPGIVKDDSAQQAEHTFVSGDKVRFHRGRPQLIGGWETAARPAESFDNPCRGVHAWATNTGDRVLAFGTSDKLHGFLGGSITDITPYKYRGTLTDPFTTVSGSAVVTVAHTAHGFKDDDSVTFALADAAGGITINGAYTVTIIDADSYTITHSGNAGSSATGGGKVEVTATLDEGLNDGTGGSGYGTSVYSSGYYGYPTGGDVDPRVWSIHGWGNNGVMVPRNGALYEWQPAGTYGEIVTNGTFASASSWTTGTGWSIGAGVATATAGVDSALTQSVVGLLTGGAVYELSVVVTRVAGTLQFEVTSADGPTDHALGAVIAKSGTYTRYFRAPSSPTTIRFHKDSSFDGTVDTVSIKLASIAYRINEAPQYSIGMFVDPNRMVVTYGTVEADGDYNALCVRWCSQENLTVWTPSDDNLAGEYILARGSRCVGGLPTRGRNLIFTDDAVYSMQFTGNSGDVFRFDLVGEGCGLAGKNAVAEHNGWVFWWGRNNQFYVFRGGEPQIIECPVRRDVVDNLAPSQQEKIYCGINSEFNEVWWAYADSRDGNECSRVVAYNWVEDTWATHEFEITAWVRGGVFPYPLAFWTDGLIYYHEKGSTANGSTIDWHLESGYFDIEDGNNFIVLRKYKPDFDDQSGSVNMYIYLKNFPNGTALTKGPYTLSTSTEEVNFRLCGRHVKIRWEDGTNCAFVRMGAIVFDVEKAGILR